MGKYFGTDGFRGEEDTLGGILEEIKIMLKLLLGKIQEEVLIC